jgi:hypothetical protein
LENSLLEKITKMNMNMSTEYKVDLKPDELTFANILENNYTFLDINKSLSVSEIELNTDIKSSSSGSSYYSSGSSYYSSNNNSNNSNNNNNNNNNNNSNSNNNDLVSEKIENLNNLLF